jgi:hypothetical protein
VRGSDFDVIKAQHRPDDDMSDAVLGTVRRLIPYRT